MYFPINAAKQLSAAPALPNLQPEPVIDLAAHRRSLFCTLTANGLTVWRVRVRGVLAVRVRRADGVL